MCDKMAISDYILKVAENDPFLGFKWELRKSLIVANLFSANKQYAKIKLMQNKTNLWSTFLVKEKYW